MLEVGRYTVLVAATVASLSCGLNYCFSAYAPQLGNRLHLTSTQLNTVGAAGNLGVYLSSPVIGRIVDRNGPKPTLVFAAVALSSGYLIIRAFYTTAPLEEDGTDTADGQGWFAVAGLPGLVAAQLLTGMGSTAGLSSVGNSVAKSFRKRRAAALSVVLSGFGLSAFFYSTIASIFLHPASSRPPPQPHPRSPLFQLVSSLSDPTSAFLLLLALGSLLSMLVGLVFVRPVPLSSSGGSPPLEAVKSTPGHDAPRAQGQGVVVATERDPLLPPAPSPSPRGASSSRSPIPDETTTTTTTERNITGWALFRELDFYLIFLFNGLCAGVGLCYINNLGTIVRSLSLPLGVPTDQVARHQSQLVSLLSVFNFLGRLLSGFGSDWLLHGGGGSRTSRSPKRSNRTDAASSSPLTPPPGPVRSIPRVVFLPLTSLLFLISQLSLLPLTSPSRLFLPTALTGLAHGCLFGISGIIGLERFGIKSFSQTNGVLALAPAFFGQTTNLIFGRIYDSHLSPSLTSFPKSRSYDGIAAAIPGGQQCLAGRACYVQATYLTCGMAALATCVGAWLAFGRKEMRSRAA